ncbi:hypothetical protein BD31_I1240 [Candidatus Nitrosopumilus salaria BD31]|uniref:Uncharacterized protein n=1 Tax=Candidatus Nitrosopumilus salarius BD31 TaxID=859350 RepID=I3D479_9ARCH|nr:hypothetical protein [Candidatus Nitrosopumilus salaria]EIJ66522.1 hypothetical protein BD31_I1240 [Candidatus Nitrosopumilus salaria BD31]
MLPLSGERHDAKGIVSEKINSSDILRGSSTLKRGFAHMLKKWSCNGCHNCGTSSNC